jgi:hypothetical protein
MAQGTFANRTGNNMERIIKSLAENAGYTIVSYSDYKKDTDRFLKKQNGTFRGRKQPIGYCNHERLLLTNVPYTTMYNHDGRTEFVLWNRDENEPERKIRIETKWQQSSGSVDEKFPYTILNAYKSYPEDEFVIVHGGEGFKEGAVRWLVEANESLNLEYPDKTGYVMSIDKYIEFFNREFA